MWVNTIVNICKLMYYLHNYNIWIYYYIGYGMYVIFYKKTDVKKSHNEIDNLKQRIIQLENNIDEEFIYIEYNK